MIYIVEPKEYEKTFNNDNLIEQIGHPKVMGRKTDVTGRVIYDGCYVFESPEDAEKYTGDSMKVFGAEADWKEDTIEVEDEDYRYLKNDAKVVNLDD